VELQGKVALITGGAHRVGKAITMILAQAGVDVVINHHRSAQAAVETTAEAQALGVDALALQCDVADWRSVQAMAAAIQAHFGRVDVIVNSAGDFRRTPFPASEVETWRRVVSVSIDGTFYVCNSCVPLMPANVGAIVNIVDMAAFKPWPNFAAHGVGKAGMMALTRQLAMELAPSIRVNAVSPGYVLPPPHFDEEQIAQSAHRTALGRWGTPDDVAGAVKYLLEAEYITGEVIVVDGGERLVR
jgi:NAD(P)-dependent dehydrogenase (short-subunit alcohol dehydrogenase family)